jgi:CRP/FNR family transcriptional regulator, polysaccharide utilization system transcription regulator
MEKLVMKVRWAKVQPSRFVLKSVDFQQLMKKKILIIEDNEDLRENIAEILELDNYIVFVAENGKKGVEMAEKHLPDLIICDVMMPVLDGYGTLSILHRKTQTADIPFIFLSAKSEKVDFRYGMNLGADDYITKPFENNELLKVVEMHLKKSEKFKNALKQSIDNHHFINEAKGVDALKSLTVERETRHFVKKNVIYMEGSVPRYLYYIQKGKVKIFKTNTDGKELIINILGEKDIFGLTGFLSNNHHTKSAVALEDCDLTLIPKEDFTTLLYSNRDVSARFIKMLTADVIGKEERLLNLAYNSVRKRVSVALVLLYERYGSESISILREDLAALTGTAKETVIRTLTDFKEERLIEIEEGKIILLKPEKLKNLLN